MTNRSFRKAPRWTGRQEAIHLYTTLARGQRPPTVLAPDFTGGPVFMDAPFTYARYYAMNVRYQPSSMFAVASPGLVAAATIGHAIGTTIGYARALSLSTRKWRDHRPARVVVTTTSTWCATAGDWLCFDHDAVLGYQLAGDACILTFQEAEPLRLTGPSAWCHAVLFAYLNCGPTWPTAPFLYPMRQARQHPATP